MAAKVPFTRQHLSPEYQRPTIEDFYTLYRPYTLRSVINSGVNPSDAEDVVHEIFIKFLYGGYYDSYDFSTNVSFKNFYRHVMKLYLRGMAESLHLKSARIDLLDHIDPLDRSVEQAEHAEFEFMESVRDQTKYLTDEQAVVLMATADLALDRAPRITLKEVARMTGVRFHDVKPCYEAIAKVFEWQQ